MSNESVARKSNLTAGTQAGSLPPDLKPWQRFDWPPCTQSRIFREWGDYYARRLLNQKAVECFGQALAACKNQGEDNCCTAMPKQTGYMQKCRLIEGGICHQAFNLLHKRSKCKRYIAEPEEAVLDSKEAQTLMELDGNANCSVILGKCDAVFDCNQFEDNLVLLHTEARKFQGQSIKNHFQLRTTRALSVLQDSLGDAYHPFMLQNWPLITDAALLRRSNVAFMPRPLWQQLRENQHCDVESILNKKKASLSPLERARRRACENVYNFQYLGNGASDVNMLRQLRNDKNFLNPLSREATPYMSELSNGLYTIVRKFMKMMHCRKPLYQRTQEKCRYTKICEKNRENYLYRVEYQTRRDCFRMLREVRRRRDEKNIEQLTNYVEHIMSTNIVLKTHRTLPWKWEFVTEVYNILALAHVDRCAVPKNIDFLDLKNHAVLYLLPMDRYREPLPEFGGRNVYAEIDKDEARHNLVNQKIESLEERLIHSRYAIERTYLLFEIARCHFKESRFDKSMVMAQKAVHEARSCNSIIWRFNSTFLICQVHAAFNRYERLRESLNKARILAERLKSIKLQAYLALCKAVNDYELDYHRRRHSEFSLRRHRRRKGRPSQSSADSGDNTWSSGAGR